MQSEITIGKILRLIMHIGKTNMHIDNKNVQEYAISLEILIGRLTPQTNENAFECAMIFSIRNLGVMTVKSF